MAYKRYIWVDEESQLDAYHLNNIEDGIEGIIDGDLTVDKANKDGDGNIITGSYGSNINFEFDHGTGIVTLKLIAKDGTILQTSSIDLPTEYLIKQIYLDDADKNLVFVLSNDTEIKCDISAIYDKIDTKADKTYVDDIKTDLDTKLDTKLDKEYIVLTNTVIAYAEKINDDDAIILTNLYNKYEGITPEIPLFVRDKNNNIALLSFYNPDGLRFQVISNASDEYFPIVTWQIGTIKSFSGNGKYYLHNILGQNAWKESVTAYVDIDSNYKLVLANNNKIITGQNDRSVVVPPFTYNSFDTFTLGSNLTITGNLSVSGTTTTVDTETLKVKDNVIVTNSDKNKLIDLSGLAINTDETNTFGIMYDPTSNTVDLGLGTITTEGKFTFNENEGLPLAIRDRNSSFTQDHLISWSTDKNKLVDSGIDKSVIDNKVDKVQKGIYWQVYGIGTEGAPLPENDGKTINATQEAVPNTLINRDAGGVAQVNNPQSDKDIANKLYVDGRMDYIVFNDTIFSARSTLTQTEYNNLYAFYDKHYNKDKIPLFAIDKNGSIALVSFEPLKWVDFTLFNDKLSPITLTIQVSTDTGHSRQFSYNSGYLHNILGQDSWKKDVKARIGVNSDNKLIITDESGNQTPGQSPSVVVPPFSYSSNKYNLDGTLKASRYEAGDVVANNHLFIGNGNYSYDNLVGDRFSFKFYNPDYAPATFGWGVNTADYTYHIVYNAKQDVGDDSGINPSHWTYDIVFPRKSGTVALAEDVDTKLDNKVDKVAKTNRWQLYGVGDKTNDLPNGGTINAESNAAAYTVINRDGSGRAKINDPVNNLDITNKQYVDNNFERKTVLSNVLPTDNILLDLHNYQLESAITSDFSFIMPANASDEYLSEISFTTGPTLVAFTTTSAITFTGEDCSNTHTFVPDTNKHYNIIFWKDKAGFQAVVRGY